jgi:uncharacterized protein DUF1214
MVNDYHEATYFIRGTDAKGTLLDGRYAYTMTFPKSALPPVDRSRGGFWSLTMYVLLQHTAGPYILVKRDGRDLVRRPIYVRSTSKRAHQGRAYGEIPRN